MDVQVRLRQVIDHQQDHLRAGVPTDRQVALLAVVRAIDQQPHEPVRKVTPDLISAHRLTNLGGNKAILLCLDAVGNDGGTVSPTAGAELDGWARRFLEQCELLADAELVLGHCETGFMRLVEEGDGTFDAWIATKRVPTSWRERADFDWWAASLSKRYEPELRALEAKRPATESSEQELDSYYRRLANVHLNTMAYQLGYPPDAVIDGCTVRTYCDVLSLLIARALRERDNGATATARAELDLVAELVVTLKLDAALVSRAIDAFTLDRENAAYHAAVPSVAAAPLVRVGGDQLAWSVYGLLTEPLLFLTRELRRRSAQAYHNTAYLREDVFRQDLYALFQDKRFVTSAGKLELRRAAGDVRTDIDAVVFDRKSGTLGFFELKTQDPFARTTAELARQRDNVLYANRQVSGVLTWLNQHGGDELLNRVDRRTARTFRVQKVYPFVLGRYLAHFSDGAEPDRRAAWGTWPQVLRLLGGQSPVLPGSNPIASLYTRLSNDVANVHVPIDAAPRVLDIGDSHLVVYPSFAAMQASAGVERGT